MIMLIIKRIFEDQHLQSNLEISPCHFCISICKYFFLSSIIFSMLQVNQSCVPKSFPHIYTETMESHDLNCGEKLGKPRPC